MSDQLGEVDIRCMYKEVAGYFQSGVGQANLPVNVADPVQLKVPEDGKAAEVDCIVLMTVTILFADDNWGNIVTVLPPGDTHAAGAGLYYHVDCE